MYRRKIVVNGHFGKSIRRAVALCFIVLGFHQISYSRDIDLDSIYIKKSSPHYQKLFEAKLEAYQKAGSRFIDSGIIHADWTSGFDIIYIKETQTTNIAYVHNRKTQATEEIFRFNGTPTVVKISPNGRFLFVKRILIEESGMPKGDGFSYDLITKNKWSLPGNYPFIDFSISPSGNSIVHEISSGIAETELGSKQSKLLRKKSDYQSIVSADSPSLLFLSPNRQNMAAMCGSGGNYSAKIFFGKKSWSFNEITSPLEFYWVSNYAFAYRKGGTGNFSVYLYNIKDKSMTGILTNSLHTSINYSPYPKILSFLKDQIIHLYYMRDKKSLNTGLEGDDVAFSPDGNRFISLIKQRLFLTEVSHLVKKQQDVRKVHRNIAELYKALLTLKSNWENDYSPVYINRKISLYSE